ncbi:hypothetical protein AM571_CH04030 [Rhizobium etli 8C-3]|uniref:Uncharacterized protein n=2 Tax=Rhizobium TaxID=379 RepID=A0A4R3RK28_9HYPH|nr:MULTISPECIES: DUF6152 family protein [Rhizobium]APO76808.1 hypothetical protein AM571_CH04030 [Rhizobium etli 8C-3]TCU23790.1 hypothetical protein EV130_107145 [Rhizobium azibense]TCU36060.1 hypothetical protein EV129_108147 [Rhizobium azibense]
MNLRSLMSGAVVALYFAASVQAHHGWGAYDTDRPLYLEGTVAEIHWRNPHPEVVIEVPVTPPRANLVHVPVPPELEKLGIREVLAKARAPERGGRYTLDLARLDGWRVGA